MARMPGATWRPISVNHNTGGMGTIHGVTLHIMAGTLTGTDGWFRNPKARASSHFGTGKDKRLYQWVDTKDEAWAQAAGNPSWISVENEGKGGDALTDDQLDSCARVLAWAHTTHGVPLQITTSPSGRGLGHHAMGGRPWGNHPSCPGPRIIAQKPEILRATRLLVDGKADSRDRPAAAHAPAWPGRLFDYPPIVRGADVRVWQAQMDHLGYELEADGAYGPQSQSVCITFQRKAHLKIDGIVGRDTWTASFA